MGHSRVQKIYPAAGHAGAIDYGVTTVSFVWLPPEDMIVYGWGVQTTEATHTTTITTQPVVTFAYDAANAGTTTSKGTLTVGAAGEGIGKEYADVTLTPFKVDASAGDALEWTTTTAISGTATTGTGQPFVYAEVFPALVGA
jgi:hypothetical protein